jgi:ferric-dicitrate binding protein FerR (iron transport regulator)
MKEEYQIEEIITKVFNGQASAEETEQVAVWLKQDVANKTYFAQLKNIWDVSHPPFNPEAIEVDRAYHRVMKQIEPRTYTLKPLLVWWQKTAAILLIPLSLLLGYLLIVNHQSRSDLVWQEVSSPYGMTSQITLSDGSTVWLNSGSKLKYPVKFDANERKVTLSGEAFFKVQSDKKHPFIVSAENIKVVATGTQFNVEAYRQDTIRAVTLVEGKVDISVDEDQLESLSPSQRLVYNSVRNKYVLSETETLQWSAWKDGMLIFRDQPLVDVFKRISRTFNVDIQVKDQLVAQQQYRATFTGESLDEILRLLKLSSPIQYKRIAVDGQFPEGVKKERIEVYGMK